MTSNETVEQAWYRIMGTPFPRGTERATFFECGFNAGKGRA